MNKEIKITVDDTKLTFFQGFVYGYGTVMGVQTALIQGIVDGVKKIGNWFIKSTEDIRKEVRKEIKGYEVDWLTADE